MLILDELDSSLGHVQTALNAARLLVVYSGPGAWLHRLQEPSEDRLFVQEPRHLVSKCRRQLLVRGGLKVILRDVALEHLIEEEACQTTGAGPSAVKATKVLRTEFPWSRSRLPTPGGGIAAFCRPPNEVAARDAEEPGRSSGRSRSIRVQVLDGGISA